SAEARLSLRRFVAALPSSPYAAHARRRLAAADTRVDPRELEVPAAGADSRALLAQVLGPLVPALEACFPADRLVRIRLQVARTSLRSPPEQPAADCLDRALSRVDTAPLATVRAGTVVVPLAGRRAAPSAQ